MGKKIIDNVKQFFKENYKYLCILLVILILFQYELPYKIYTPGGMVNLSDRIRVEGGSTSEGELGMAYVSMVRGSIPFLLLSYIIPDWDIVPADGLGTAAAHRAEGRSLRQLVHRGGRHGAHGGGVLLSLPQHGG